MAVTLQQIADGSRCLTCNGSGLVIDENDNTIECLTCLGTGYGTGETETPAGLRKVAAILAQAVIDLQR